MRDARLSRLQRGTGLLDASGLLFDDSSNLIDLKPE